MRIIELSFSERRALICALAPESRFVVTPYAPTLLDHVGLEPSDLVILDQAGHPAMVLRGVEAPKAE